MAMLRLLIVVIPAKAETQILHRAKAKVPQ
jgi:hypothetical protein